jgi:SAM-dependent methyltransferase
MRSIDLAAPDRADVIRADFDRIADVDPAAGFDASARYVAELLNLLPARIERALDLGSGSGILVRRLAARADHVTGIDLSPRMVALARASSAGTTNIDWRIGDFMADDLPAGGFDAVCSVATFHHLPLGAALARAATLVRPGGWLLVVDLFQPVGVGGFFHNAFSWLLARWEGLHRPRPSRAAREAWRAHERNDSHPTLAEVRAASATLPGARVVAHPRWRWTLAWRRPDLA